MDQQSLNLQIQRIFQQSNQPNMYYLDFQFSQSLQTLKPTPLTHYDSLQRIVNLIRIILYLKTHNLKPSQIHFSFIGTDKDNNWGLKHIICHRTIHLQELSHPYDPKQFFYHSDQDNQLVWNLGKVWLRFYTDSQIDITHQSQIQVNQIIQKAVTHEQVKSLIHKMLKVNKEERISFQLFVEHQIFIEENFSQNVCSSICMHYNMVSKIQKVSNSLTNKHEIKSPFEEQILRRDLKQSLEICYLLQKCISVIRSMFEKSIDIQFHEFIIKAEAYCILNKIDNRKISNRILDYTTDQKRDYSKFVTKMLLLKQQLERKMKTKMFSSDQGLNHDQKKFLIPTDNMALQKIHPAFKNIIIFYYTQTVTELKEISSKNQKQDIKIKKICTLQKRALIFLLTRLSNQIFSQLRSHIFEQLLKNIEGEKIFSVRSLINFIQSCDNPYPLKKIRNSVHNNGLQKFSSENKIQSRN